MNGTPYPELWHDTVEAPSKSTEHGKTIVFEQIVKPEQIEEFTEESTGFQRGATSLVMWLAKKYPAPKEIENGLEA